MPGKLRVAARWVAIASVALTVALRVVYVHRATARPYGRFSADQVLEKAQRLCSVIDSRTSGTVYMVRHSSGFPIATVWEASCAEPGGRDIAHLTWDGDTGDLLAAGHLMPVRTAYTADPQLDRAAAICMAARWMRDLGVARQSHGWQVERAQLRAGRLWNVRWRSPDAVAYVALAPGGDLRELLFRRSRYSVRLRGALPASAPPGVVERTADG